MKPQLFQDLLDQSKDALQISDCQGNLLYINKKAEERLGILQSEVRNYNVSDFEKEFKKGGKLNWGKHIEELRKEKSITVEGININQKNQKEFPVEVTISFKEFEGLGYIFAVSRDITERKLKLFKLELNKNLSLAIFELYKSLIKHLKFDHRLFDSMDTITQLLDLQEIFFYEINQYGKFELSYNHNNKQHIKSFFTKDEASNLGLTGETNNIQYHGPESNLREAFVDKVQEKHVLSFPFIDADDLVGFAFLTKDREMALSIDKIQIHRDILNSYYILYRKTVELNKKSKILDDLSNSVNDVFFLYDIHEDQFQFVSSSYKKVLGVDEHKFTSFEEYIAKFVHPEEQEFLIQKNQEIEPEKALEYEYRIITGAGGIKNILVKIFGMFDNNGHLQEISGIISDITQKKIDDQIIQKSNNIILKTNNELLQKNKEILKANLLLQEGKENLESEIRSKLLLMSNTNDMHNKLKLEIESSDLEHKQKQRLLNILVNAFNKNVISKVEEQFIKSHGKLVKVLTKHFNNLNYNQIKLCIFIRLGLTNKEIAQMQFVNTNSVKVAKSRLRKKLNIQDASIDVFTFLVRLEETLINQ